MVKEPNVPDAEFWQEKINNCQNHENLKACWKEFEPLKKKYALTYLVENIIEPFKKKNNELFAVGLSEILDTNPNILS